jgi:hypothetical protein
MKAFPLLSLLLGFLSQNAIAAQHALLFHSEIPISQAVSEFNAIASKDDIGKNEPILSPDEVISSIRGIVDDQISPMNSEYKKTFQHISDSGVLPANSRLGFTTQWSNYQGYDFKVWWIDLFIKPEDPSKLPKELRLGYNFRIRARFISSTPTMKTEQGAAANP